MWWSDALVVEPLDDVVNGQLPDEQEGTPAAREADAGRHPETWFDRTSRHRSDRTVVQPRDEAESKRQVIGRRRFDVHHLALLGMDPDCAGEFLRDLSFARFRPDSGASRERDQDSRAALELAGAAGGELEGAEDVLNHGLCTPTRLCLLSLAPATFVDILVVGAQSRPGRS